MKHKPKPKGSVIAALDIGSSKIACFIARLVDDDGNFEVLGIGHQAAQGIKNGTITDLDAAEAAIRRTVHAAENMAAGAMKGYPLREVVVNVPAPLGQSSHTAIDVEVAGQEIADNDVRRALARAQEQVYEDGTELIHTIPGSYSIDGYNGIREPRGMYGETLEVKAHLVTGQQSGLRNMATAVERSHLDIAALCVSPYASGLATLVEDEMDLGCTVIDLGGGTTSFAVFNEGHMIFCDGVQVGGQHVTSDIARGLTTGLADAERLKTLYGSAVGTTTDQAELIDVPQIGEDTPSRLNSRSNSQPSSQPSSQPNSQPNHVPRSLLIGIIQPRLEEILEMVRAGIEQSGAAGYAGRRVVLTGGASQLPGLRDLAQSVLDKQVRLGTPIRIPGLPDTVNGPAFATTAGLLTYISERHDELPAEIMSQVEPGTLWERVKFWLRENW